MLFTVIEGNNCRVIWFSNCKKRMAKYNKCIVMRCDILKQVLSHYKVITTDLWTIMHHAVISYFTMIYTYLVSEVQNIE